MEILIRDYRPSDAQSVVEVMRDSFESLKKSQGGLHNDSIIDDILVKPDDDLLPTIVSKDKILVVAEVQGTEEVIGTGALSILWFTGFTKSVASKNHYVKRAYQRGRAGVSVGPMLRKATIDLARKKRYCKIFGFSTLEAVGFHKKFGAIFYPRYNMEGLSKRTKIHYYEIPLKPCFWSRMHLEPYLIRFGKPYVGSTLQD